MDGDDDVCCLPGNVDVVFLVGLGTVTQILWK